MTPGSATEPSAPRQHSHAAGREYDLHGLAGVRLVDAPERQVASLERLLGVPSSALGGSPDLVLRFVDRLQLTGSWRHLDAEHCVYSDQHFVLARPGREGRGRVLLPLERIGEPGAACEIVCERGIGVPPHLNSFLNLAVLARGGLPLHATAFVWQGRGCAATGWSGAGKTGTLLAFLSQGAAYVGAEWVYLTPDGSEMLGRREPVRLRAWHLSQLPQYARLVPRSEAARLAALRAGAALCEAVPRGLRRRAPFGVLDALSDGLRRKQYVDLAPDALVQRPIGATRTSLSRLFLLVRSESPEIRRQTLAPEEAAEMLVSQLSADYMPLRRHYLAFRYAFPGRRNPLLERLEDLQRDTLRRVLQGKEIWRVEHPPQASLEALHHALRD